MVAKIRPNWDWNLVMFDAMIKAMDAKIRPNWDWND